MIHMRLRQAEDETRRIHVLEMYRLRSRTTTRWTLQNERTHQHVSEGRKRGAVTRLEPQTLLDDRDEATIIRFLQAAYDLICRLELLQQLRA
jgi:hypothetical protein